LAIVAGVDERDTVVVDIDDERRNDPVLDHLDAVEPLTIGDGQPAEKVTKSKMPSASTRTPRHRAGA